tara:strand:- start:900 stop:1949 length:1050 start_codon:yes stop_codon:yes gene_type:complete
MTKGLLFLILTTLSFKTYAQNHYFGRNSFPFLNSLYSARSAGFGSNLITIKDGDLGLSAANPALLSEKCAKNLQINQALTPAGGQLGMVTYAFKSKIGLLSPVIKFQNYGGFQGTDELGNATNKFSAIDYTLGVNYGTSLGRVINVGFGLHLIGSHLETYSSFGICGIFGANYTHPTQDFSASFIVKNIGVQLFNYTDTERLPLPVEVQAGVSYKLNHAPFRLSVLGHHLNHWRILYEDPTAQPGIDGLTGDTIPVEVPGFGKTLASHFSYAIELLASENLQFRAGFDYMRREQMKLLDRPGLSGFSFGIGLKLKKIRIDYGVLLVSKAGQNHYLGLSTNLGKWKKKRF